jgi:ATP-dependent exoDNAse (exonuclease V) beta subunit
VQHHASALASSVIEGTLMALHGETLVEGVLDVRLTSDDGTVEVWDWKTNIVRSEGHLREVADSYRTQMETYAWLCMQALPDCHRVVTRLVFTKAAVAGFARIDHEHEWLRADVSLFDVG